MFLVSIGRIFKFAIQSFLRNFWLSVVTCIIFVLTLLLINISLTLNIFADKAIDSVKERIDVTIYFSDSAAEREILDVKERLMGMATVSEVIYISAEEAWQDFRESHADDPLIAESIEAVENPLPASLVVQARQLGDYPEILASLDDPAYDELIQDKDKDFEDTQKVIDRLNHIAGRLQIAGYLLSGVFILIALIVVYNTLGIMIYTHREEISIMRLVGATSWFIRGPFIMETFIYAFLASVIAMGIFYPVLSVTAPYVNSFFEGYNLNIMDYINRNLWIVFGTELIVALVVSAIASSAAIGRYLKK
ncbi:MAG: permease-like cell division protein FtsX [Patescibacteria group bacterium]